eukprot:4922509-Pleurochrysis_carterae.AAC.3
MEKRGRAKRNAKRTDGEDRVGGPSASFSQDEPLGSSRTQVQLWRNVQDVEGAAADFDVHDSDARGRARHYAIATELEAAEAV